MNGGWLWLLPSSGDDSFGEDDDGPLRSAKLPALPTPNAAGHIPAVEYAQASLARKLIRRRWNVGLTQAELARKAGIRPETLNRIEKGKSTPDTSTVEKLVRALERAEATGVEKR